MGLRAWLWRKGVGALARLSRHVRLNRGAMVARPRQPFVDWLNQQERSGRRMRVADLRQDQTVYLVPEWETSEDCEAILEVVYGVVFERELAEWYTEPQRWPEGRDLATFKAWFEVEFFSMVADVGGETLKEVVI